MKKKLLTIVMTLCLIATMMPIYTGVAFAETTWSGTEVTILGEGRAPSDANSPTYLKTNEEGAIITVVGATEFSTSEWNIEIKKVEENSTTSYIITLRNAKISSDNLGCISSTSPNLITIKLEGENSLTTNASDWRAAIDVLQGKIKGAGKLRATATGGSSSVAIRASNLVIEDGAKVEATGNAAGIISMSNIAITGGASVIAEAKADITDANGIYVGDGDISISGAGTKVTATGLEAGIKAAGNQNGNISINDGATVRATETRASGNPYAIKADGKVSISDNDTEVTATGKSNGMFAATDVTISNNAKVTATGEGHYGIYANTNINITSGALVTAVGDTQAMNKVPTIGEGLYIFTRGTTDGDINDYDWSRYDSTSTFNEENLKSFKKMVITSKGDLIAVDHLGPAPVTPSTPYYPSAPNITVSDGVTSNVGGTATFDAATKALTITPAAGYRVKDVLLNNQSKGAVTSLEGILVYDSVKVVFEKIPEKTPEQIKAEKDAKIKAGVNDTTIKLKAKVTANGIKLTWEKSKGYKVDQYILYRSVNGGAYKPYKITKKTSFLNSKVTKGKNYRFNVKGVRTVGEAKAYTKTSENVKVKAK